MSNKKSQKKEYSVIIDIIVFLSVVSIVGLTRLYIIYFKEKTNLDVKYLDTTTNIEENLDDVNLKLVDVINTNYGIEINYGQKIKSYADSVNAKTVEDDEKIFEMLKSVNKALSKYPKGIINEIKNKGYKVRIFLVDSFNSSNIALANRTSNGEFRIYLSYRTGIERAVHHETYHILDYYTKLESNENVLYMKWNENNPKDFSYTYDTNTITSKYVYQEGLSGTYFVTPYAKYSEQEDRAETFAEMMTDDKKEVYYNTDEKIYNKMIIIRNTLYSVFESVRTNDNNYYERYL